MTKGQEILQMATKNNHTNDMLMNAYNISSDEIFDAIVIAPTWSPYRIGGFPIEGIVDCKDMQKSDVSFTDHGDRTPMMKRLSKSYIVEWNGHRIAWLKTGTCAGNVIDSTLLLANNKTEKLIFLGAAGGIVPNVKPCELITPKCCVDYVGATRYFIDEMNSEGFGKTIEPENPLFIEQILRIARQKGIKLSSRKVFCTDTIIGEYLQMNRILGTGAEVIEMETSAFYCATSLMKKIAAAFLVISDNHSIGESLSAPKRELFEHYNQTIKNNIPILLDIVCKAEI